MRSPETKAALTKELYSHSLSATLGTVMLAALLTYETGADKISGNLGLQIGFVLVFTAIAFRLLVIAKVRHFARVLSLAGTKKDEILYGLFAVVGGAGYCTVAHYLNSQGGFSHTDSIVSLLAVCATATAATTSLSASRWIAQTFLAVTLLKLSVFFFLEPELRTLSLMTLVYYVYLSRSAELQFRRLSKSFANEIAIARDQERLKHFVDSVPTGISLLDANLNYAAFNRMHMDTLGTDATDLIGKPLLRSDPFFNDAQALSNDPKSSGCERRIELMTCEGKRWHLISLRKLQHTNQIICMTIDIHNETKLQNAQREAQARMVQSAKMASLGEMAGGISHEINNPLAIIVGKTDVLLDRLQRGPIATETLAKDLQKLKDTAFRISKIVRGLRAFSRSGESDPFTPMKVTPLIEDSIELCRERFKNSSVDLRIDLSVEAEISCRPSQVSQVVLNLLNNAYDAIQGNENTWIEIRTEIRASGPAIVVTDSGAGIPTEVATRLMEPFFTTKPVNQGTGLGLSISKGLIEDHGGRLLYDATSVNTRFVVEFPAVDASASRLAS